MGGGYGEAFQYKKFSVVFLNSQDLVNFFSRCVVFLLTVSTTLFSTHIHSYTHPHPSIQSALLDAQCKSATTYACVDSLSPGKAV